MQKISKEAMRIIKRGGNISKNEETFLFRNTPNDLMNFTSLRNNQLIVAIYLHEARGYCCMVYNSTDFNENCTIADSDESYKTIWDSYLVNGFPEQFLYYIDLSQKKHFLSYKELEDYTRENGESVFSDQDLELLERASRGKKITKPKDVDRLCELSNYSYESDKNNFLVIVKPDSSRLYLPYFYDMCMMSGFIGFEKKIPCPMEAISEDGKGNFNVNGRLIKDYINDYIFEK